MFVVLRRQHPDDGDLWLQALVGEGEAPAGFILAVSLWLWFTVLFANFAEAMAEGRGKAQADALRKAAPKRSPSCSSSRDATRPTRTRRPPTCKLRTTSCSSKRAI